MVTFNSAFDDALIDQLIAEVDDDQFDYEMEQYLAYQDWLEHETMYMREVS